MYTYQAMYLTDDLTELNLLLATGNTIIDNVHSVGTRQMVVLRTRVERQGSGIRGASTAAITMPTPVNYSYGLDLSDQAEAPEVEENPFTYTSR